MSVFLKSYSKAVKRYDTDLFAGRTKDGAACIFRSVKRFEPVVEMEGFKLLNLREGTQFVVALTNNWALSGKPCDWGIDHILNKLQKMDALANERFFEEMDAANERIDESKKRHLKNEMEAFFKDERRRFAKATDGILTHSLSKDEPKRRLKERSIKNGNY